MKIIYEADDGKRFSNEEECFYYDWNLNHSNIKEISFIDQNNDPVPYSWDEGAYYDTEKVIIPSIKALYDLHAYADLLGFNDYKTIDDIGTWVHNEKGTGFRKSYDLEMDLDNERA